MIYLTLFYEFIKTGLFSIGGGLATLPFLFQIAERYPWFTVAELVNMIAISESTPGPIGINMATYAGMVAGGVLGGIIASFAMAIPSVVISSFLARGLQKYKDSKILKSAFYGIRPAVCALIAMAGIGIMKEALFDLELFKVTENIGDLFKIMPIIIFVTLLFFSNKYKKHPIFYIAIAGVLGIILKF
ncbi:MAG: chromate transporter [Erysipelotrichaceae bacterium]|nr:chromate transporter [Erysipelotrichaceae bacterium]MDD3923956.1 chromate transporter [Erysipelotrichaceae bacterium]MDD4642224.1 chromate transporter [Erysipelotrichaceae bacterium]